MTDSPLHAALRAGPEGLCAFEVGTGLIIAHGTWTGRPDFACHIQVAPHARALCFLSALMPPSRRPGSRLFDRL